MLRVVRRSGAKPFPCHDRPLEVNATRRYIGEFHSQYSCWTEFLHTTGASKAPELKQAFGSVDARYSLAAFKGNPAQAFRIPPISRTTASTSREFAHHRAG